jgi:hypothetical protein
MCILFASIQSRKRGKISLRSPYSCVKVKLADFLFHFNLFQFLTPFKHFSYVEEFLRRDEHKNSFETTTKYYVLVIRLDQLKYLHT